MRRVSEREPVIRQFVIVKNKLTLAFYASVLAIDLEFRHHIVKVVCGSTATLTM